MRVATLSLPAVFDAILGMNLPPFRATMIVV